ncbi:MAG: Gfo/Idh/MocA family oxidoreductase [Ruminococcaceae bacterium]|nr:Gfo/Idh/MocA family oxidoreductase [Oscillospiraceae bacterium]
MVNRIFNSNFDYEEWLSDHFGKNAQAVKSAVKAFSNGFRYYPHNIGTLYQSTQQVGPSRVILVESNHYIIDLGKETVGLVSLDFVSPAVQKITVAWGEDLQDGHVRQKIEHRDFSFDYVAEAGKNEYVNYMLRLGCRYLEIHTEAPIEINNIGLIPQIYPVKEKQVTLDNALDQKIYDACVNTLKLCMMEHYVDMLLEKPIVPNREELLELQSLAREKGVKINVCHVLRYTSYYKRIKVLINAGEIGNIMTMELNEHVWIAHFIDSFVRGKWKSEKNCGSGFLLQKSCHDMDLICWLNNASKPVKVSSFGSRSQFILKNAPEGATKYCYNCPHNSTCLYSAQKIHLEYDSMPFQTWDGLHKPLEEITYEEKEEYLRHSDYGLCAYNSGGDISDRQTITVEFENGSLASFTMVGATN